jgi:hypothetical protein
LPKTLHQSKGLTIKKNDINQFCIVTLHYTADPAKRSAAWKQEAQAGMIPAKWDKEYEINYTSLFGERVFPMVTTHRQYIVVPEPHIEFPSTQAYWGGFDYGLRNPSSFHVYTIHDSVIYSVWELFEPCKNYTDFVAKMKMCPYWDNIKYIAADPSIFNRTQLSAAGNIPPSELFQKAGVTKLIRGNNDETAWLTMMREHWQNPEDPTFKIFSCCPNQIREFESSVYADMSEKAMMTSNYREEIVDHNNHSLDDCKYFMNSRPRLQQKTLKLPIMYKRWLK